MTMCLHARSASRPADGSSELKALGPLPLRSPLVSMSMVLFGRPSFTVNDVKVPLHKSQGEDSESSSYLLHSEIEPPSQKKPQRSTVHVPDLCGNLFDTCLAGLQ